MNTLIRIKIELIQRIFKKKAAIVGFGRSGGRLSIAAPDLFVATVSVPDDAMRTSGGSQRTLFHSLGNLWSYLFVQC